MHVTTLIKMTLPVVFFGYAAAANLSLFHGPEAALATADAPRGAMTARIDTLYRENLPHKDPSVGVVGAVRYALLDEGRDGVAVGRDGILFTAEETRPVRDALYHAALARIDAAAATLTQSGTALIVVPVPAKIDVLADAAPDADAARAMADLYARFTADLAARGLPVAQARAALVATEQPFIPTDTHWTPTGAGAVAQAVADSGVIAAGTDRFDVTADAPIALTGDLVAYVTTDRLAALIGLDPFAITPLRADPVSADTGLLDLFGDAGGGVDLVGTSYSANPHWSFETALKRALRRDVVNHAREGFGPFAPMRAYLEARDPLASAEAVIWEIPVRYLTDPTLVSAEVAG